MFGSSSICTQASLLNNGYTAAAVPSAACVSVRCKCVGCCGRGAGGGCQPLIPASWHSGDGSLTMTVARISPSGADVAVNCPSGTSAAGISSHFMHYGWPQGIRRSSLLPDILAPCGGAHCRPSARECLVCSLARARCSLDAGLVCLPRTPLLQCSALLTCQRCAGDALCGWCAASGTCVRRSEGGSACLGGWQLTCTGTLQPNGGACALNVNCTSSSCVGGRCCAQGSSLGVLRCTLAVFGVRAHSVLCVGV